MKNFELLYYEITAAAFKKHGFINAKILNQWGAIVGESLAKICEPQKITFEPNQTRNGVLHITVSNPAFSLELSSYEARIIERVATFFGYKAVSKIRISVKPKKSSEIKQAAFIHNKKLAAEIELSKRPIAISIKLPKILDQVHDEELKLALASLYESLFKE